MNPSLRHRFDPLMVEIFDTADGVRAPYLQFAWRNCLRVAPEIPNSCRANGTAGWLGAIRIERQLYRLGVNL
jgi:hypothetical protein